MTLLIFERAENDLELLIPLPLLNKCCFWTSSPVQATHGLHWVATPQTHGYAFLKEHIYYLVLTKEAHRNASVSASSTKRDTNYTLMNT